MSELKKGMFGITEETKDSNAVAFLVATPVKDDPQFPNGWKFPVARLVNVSANPALVKNDGSTASIIDFVFVDVDKRRHIHREWEQDPNDKDFQKKHDGLTVRINHIYKTIFTTLPQGGIGTNASNYTEFFAEVVKAFNSQVVNVKVEGGEDKVVKVFTQSLLYYKCTYYKTNFGFPLSPNFLEKVVPNQPCKILTINIAHDDLEPSKKAKAPSMPGMGSVDNDMPSNLPAFENGYN